MNWVGKQIEVQGNMGAVQYCEILEEGVEGSIESLEMAEDMWYFQQDNNPKHTRKKDRPVVFWQQHHHSHEVACPIPLNPIEHLWQQLKAKLHQCDTPPKGVHDLWDRVAKEWNEIPPEIYQKLIESMPRRIQAVLKAKGGHTKYYIVK